MQILSLSVFLFIFTTNALLRSFTFDFSTLDWDEVTYIMMGEGIRQGMIPFVDLWDIKPIGLYLIYTVANSLLGYNLETVRVLTLFFISLSAFGFFCILKKYNFWLAIFISNFFQLGFIFLPSGLAGNTEVFFIFFQIWGVYFFFRKSLLFQSLGAFLIGYAFIIKYIIIFEIIGICFVFLFYNLHRNRYNINKNLLVVSIPLLFLCLPFLLVGMTYWLLGHWDAYWNMLVILSTQYSVPKTILEKLVFISKFFQSYAFILPMLAFLTLLLLNYKTISKLNLINKLSFLGFVWFTTACIGASWTGYQYEHYLLALLPGFHMFLAGILIPTMRRINKKKLFRLSLTFIIITFIVVYSYTKEIRKILKTLPDTPKLISHDLKEKSIQSLFIASGTHTPYVLLNIFPPIKYIQPYNYSTEVFAKKIGLNIDEIIQAVANSNVDAIQFCNRDSDEFSMRLFPKIEDRYHLFKKYFPNCEVYLSEKCNQTK